MLLPSVHPEASVRDRVAVHTPDWDTAVHRPSADHHKADFRRVDFRKADFHRVVAYKAVPLQEPPLPLLPAAQVPLVLLPAVPVPPAAQVPVRRSSGRILPRHPSDFHNSHKTYSFSSLRLPVRHVPARNPDRFYPEVCLFQSSVLIQRALQL